MVTIDSKYYDTLPYILGLITRIKKRVFKIARNFPFIQGYIDEQMSKSRADLLAQFHKSTKGLDYIECLPKKGLNKVGIHYVKFCNFLLKGIITSLII